jgi:hypothetical protein
MARVNVSVPDQLWRQVRAQLPGVNFSAVLRAGLVAHLRCTHDELVCEVCTGQVERRRMLDDVLGKFYDDAQWKLREHVAGGGTLEGYGLVLKRLAQGYGVTKAATVPVVRSTRVERQRALDAKVAELPDRRTA